MSSDVKWSLMSTADTGLGFLDLSDNYSDQEVPDKYYYFDYRRIETEVNDGGIRRDNPDYEQCCNCGAVHTPEIEPYLLTALSEEQIQIRKDYLEKFKKEHEHPKVWKWRKPLAPLSPLTEGKPCGPVDWAYRIKEDI